MYSFAHHLGWRMGCLDWWPQVHPMLDLEVAFPFVLEHHHSRCSAYPKSTERRESDSRVSLAAHEVPAYGIIFLSLVGVRIAIGAYTHLQNHLLWTHAAHRLHFKVEPFWNRAVIKCLILPGWLLFLRIITQWPLCPLIDLEPMRRMPELVVWVVFK